MNGSSGGGFTTLLFHLSAGTYTLTILAGRGNPYGTNFSTFSIGWNNITNISTSLDNTSDAAAILQGNTITANTNNGSWALITYTFEVRADDTQLDIRTTGGWPPCFRRLILRTLIVFLSTPWAASGLKAMPQFFRIFLMY